MAFSGRNYCGTFYRFYWIEQISDEWYTIDISQSDRRLWIRGGTLHEPPGHGSSRSHLLFARISFTLSGPGPGIRVLDCRRDARKGRRISRVEFQEGRELNNCRRIDCDRATHRYN